MKQNTLALYYERCLRLTAELCVLGVGQVG
jgi:hypothetical protein